MKSWENLNEKEKKKLKIHMVLLFIIIIIYIFIYIKYKELFITKTILKYLFYIDFILTCIISILIIFFPKKYLKLMNQKEFIYGGIVYIVIYIYLFYQIYNNKLFCKKNIDI